MEVWTDGVAPAVIQSNYVDVPVNDFHEDDTAVESSTTYRGPVDSTLSVQELGENTEDVPWTFLCPDTADQDLDETACWQIAARKLENMQEQAAAIQKEEQLAGDLAIDKIGRKHLLNVTKEFQAAVGKVASSSFQASLEKALQAECQSTHEDSEVAARTSDEPLGTSNEHPRAGFEKTQNNVSRLVVPTHRKYANMWNPSFWQEWNPMLWCYGDCVYGDPALYQDPYKQPTYKDFCRNILLREELEYDLYPGENYRAEGYGEKHWQHEPDVDKLLRRAQQAKNHEIREPTTDPSCMFGINRFRKDPVTLFVLSTFWRLMAGFTAVNIGMRIPGIQHKLKELAALPAALLVMSAEAGDNHGVMGLIRSASHLFNLIMGKVVGSNGYRISCRHQFSAYTIFFGPPLIFCTPNIADNRNFIILLS